MSPVSSDTLFHFTKKDRLLGILEREFHPRLCLETFDFPRHVPFRLAIPMVSFCDIPLSQVNAHMTEYGHYGIGMSRDWAIRNGLNPVLYLSSDSALAKLIDGALTSITDDIAAIRRQGISVGSAEHWRDTLYKVFRFLKPQAGEDTRLGSGRMRRFYDEREWRYVPDPSAYDSPWIMVPESRYADPLVSDLNAKLSDAPLRFEPSDINYLIIKEESERLELIRQVDRIKSRYDPDTKAILSSKVVSASSIARDF